MLGAKEQGAAWRLVVGHPNWETLSVLSFNFRYLKMSLITSILMAISILATLLDFVHLGLERLVFES